MLKYLLSGDVLFSVVYNFLEILNMFVMLSFVMDVNLGGFSGTCRTSFHPICAREASHRMEVWGRYGCDNVSLLIFCFVVIIH